MRVRITKGVVGEDGQDWFAGEIHETSAHFARALIQQGRAEAAPVEEIEDRDPKPAKRKK